MVGMDFGAKFLSSLAIAFEVRVFFLKRRENTFKLFEHLSIFIVCAGSPSLNASAY